MNEVTPERWKPVPGWEGLYEASSLGRARSLPRMAMTGRAGMKLRPGRILKPHRSPRGYLYVNFSRPGFRQTFQVHVLVMLTFAGPCVQRVAAVPHLPHGPSSEI